jgi:hypothetical protein
VDFETIGVVVAGGQSGSFEAGDTTAAEAREEQHRIVDRALTHPGSGGSGSCDLAAGSALEQRPFLDEGLLDGALYADDFYMALEPEKQKTARKIFIQLVQPGEGTEDTRRLATKTELGEGNWDLVQELADARLVVTDQSLQVGETVELVHEVLINGWGQLQGWLHEDRAFRTWQERLRGNIRQWEASGRDEGALLRGAPLAEAEGWLEEGDIELSQAELEFIRASLEFSAHRIADRERSRRRIIIGLAVGLIFTILLGAFAGLQLLSAQRARSEALTASDLTKKALARS